MVQYQKDRVVIHPRLINKFLTCDYVVNSIEEIIQYEQGDISPKHSIELRNVLISVFNIENIRRAMEFTTVTIGEAKNFNKVKKGIMENFEYSMTDHKTGEKRK